MILLDSQDMVMFCDPLSILLVLLDTNLWSALQQTFGSF